MNKLLTNEYKGLDLGKFVCAILVIAIHTEPFINNIWLDRGLGVITRLAVPFFFMVTGYLFFDGFERKEKLAHTLKRLLILYALWSLIYLPFNWPIDDLINKIFITGINGHLWYIPAAMFSLLITFFLRKCLGLKKTLMIAGFLLVLGTLLSTYEPVTAKMIGGGYRLYSIIDVIGTRNGLFYGFFYVSLGGFLRSKKTTKTVYYAILLFAGICLLSIESLIAVMKLHATSTILWFSCPIAMIGMFGIFQNINLKCDTIRLRKISVLMYFSHCIWIHSFEIEQGLTLFLIVLILSIISSMLIIRLSEKFTWMKYLY